MVAAREPEKRDDERRELVSKIVPSGEIVVITVEQEDGPRKRQVVKVWREPKTMQRSGE